MRILKTNDWFQHDDCPLAVEQRARDHGFTLVLEPHRTILAKHHHFESVEAALHEGADIIPSIEVVRQWDKPKCVADSLRGGRLRHAIAQLGATHQSLSHNDFPQYSAT